MKFRFCDLTGNRFVDANISGRALAKARRQK